MKFQIPIGALCRTLKAASTAQPKTQLLAILSSVYIDAQEEGVTFRTTDTDQQFSIRVPCNTLAPGQACISLSTLHSHASTFPSAETIEIDASDKEAKVICGESSRTLLVNSVEDFPLLPPPESEALAVLPVGEFLKGMELVADFTSREASKPSLNGVLVELRPGWCRLVASDTFRLSMVEFPVECQDETSVVVPNEALSPLRALLTNASKEEACDVFVSNSATFRIGGNEFQTRLLAETFPNYRKFLPDKDGPFCGRVSVDRGEFDMSLRRAAACSMTSGESAYKVQWFLSPDKGQILMLAQSAERGKSKEPILARFQAESMEMQCGVNGNYTQSMLLAVRDARTLQLSYNKPLDAMIVTTPEIPNWQYVLLPMRP